MDSIQRFLHFPIDQLPYVVISLLIAFTVHEFSHAYFANRLGDPTAKNEGRLTLNPMAHLDVLGTIMIFIAGFGWAKPVPVNYFHLRNRRLGVLISVAGPLSNLLVATVAMGIWFALYQFGLFSHMSETLILTITKLLNTLIYLNIILFIFNLLPIPPLDGYRVIEDLATERLRPKLIQWEQYGVFVFLLLVLIPALGNLVFAPIFTTVKPFVFQSLQNIYLLLFGLY